LKIKSFIDHSASSIIFGKKSFLPYNIAIIHILLFDIIVSRPEIALQQKVSSELQKGNLLQDCLLGYNVGTTRFELATPRPPDVCATGLRYVPF
jgi:hypothetical protein